MNTTPSPEVEAAMEAMEALPPPEPPAPPKAHGIVDLENRFQYHPPQTDERRIAHSSVRVACFEAAQMIDALCPDGREKSTAITKLEEAMFWANAAIARQP